MNPLHFFSKKSKKALAVLVVAGALLAIGCAGVATVVDPAKPSLLEVSPDAKVYPIGRVPMINGDDRSPFEHYPEAALRKVNMRPPKVGCVMVEVLIGEDGRVKRTAIAEEFPRSYFQTAAMGDARRDLYPKQNNEIITYHFYQFNIDKYRDTGLVRTSRFGGVTEVTLEMSLELGFEGIVRNEAGWSTMVNAQMRMPKQCESLYNKYAVPFPEATKSASPRT